MKHIRNIVTSFGIAAALAAITLAGLNTGIANAQGGIPANVVIVMPANVGQFDETPGQSWISLHRLADHGMYTGTFQTAQKTVDIGAKGSHTAEYRGNREFVANGVAAGDYLAVAHLGNKTLVMNQIHSVAMGDQYGASQTDRLTWTGTGMGASSMAAPKPQTVSASKHAAPTGTAMCKLGATNDITTTQTATVVVGATGDVFTGKLLFIQSTVKMLTAESALAVFAKDPKIGVERNMDGLPSGTKVTVNSGNLRVFRMQSNGKWKYMGDIDATPNSTHTKLTRVDGVCEPYKLVAGATPTTGTAQNIAAILMLIGGLAFAAVAIGGKFKLIPLSLPLRG